jgi:hypothetical protein
VCLSQHLNEEIFGKLHYKERVIPILSIFPDSKICSQVFQMEYLDSIKFFTLDSWNSIFFNSKKDTIYSLRGKVEFHYKDEVKPSEIFDILSNKLKTGDIRNQMLFDAFKPGVIIFVNESGNLVIVSVNSCSSQKRFDGIIKAVVKSEKISKFCGTYCGLGSYFTNDP